MQLKPYLKTLMDMELLDKKGPYYRTTEKGIRWLEVFQTLNLLEAKRK